MVEGVERREDKTRQDKTRQDQDKTRPEDKAFKKNDERFALFVLMPCLLVLSCLVLSGLVLV